MSCIFVVFWVFSALWKYIQNFFFPNAAAKGSKDAVDAKKSDEAIEDCNS